MKVARAALTAGPVAQSYKEELNMIEHNQQIARDIARELAHEFGLEPDNHWEAPVVRHIAEDLERMSYQEAHARWRTRLGVIAKVAP